MRGTPLLVTLLVAPTVLADDKARALVENAIKAHGGEVAVAKLRTMRIKAEGTMEVVPGQPAAAFTIEDVWQMPDKYRTTAHFTLMDMKVTTIHVIDGEKAWAELNGEVHDLSKDASTEIREQKYAEDLDRLGFLKDKDVELSLLDEVKVNGKPAAGVRVKSKGHREVKLYFDKASGLLVKREHAVLDATTGKEVTQEVVFADYEDKDGVKHYKTVTGYREGKKIADAKVTAIEFLDKVDPKLFAKP
jgi:hypothetical protein